MSKLFTIGLIFVSVLITSCATNVKEVPTDSPLSETEQQYLEDQLNQQAWDNLPIDSTTDEEFFNSTN